MTRHHLIPQERARKKNYTKDDLQVDRVLNLWDDKHAASFFVPKYDAIRNYRMPETY